MPLQYSRSCPQLWYVGRIIATSLLPIIQWVNLCIGNDPICLFISDTADSYTTSIAMKKQASGWVHHIWREDDIGSLMMSLLIGGLMQRYVPCSALACAFWAKIHL